MRARVNPAEALVMLPGLSDPAERRASWRQAITALGQGIRVTGPPPLDGVDPEDLLRAARTALETGLCDDLDWIAPGNAAVALYEITSTLPPSRQRTDLGRRVFARLYEGTAATFAAVATRMTLGPSRPLEAAAIHARVGLVFDLPICSGVTADPLALNFVSRPELFERWVQRASRGALPARRLAARLLEHAAREAMQRSLQADPHPRALLAHDSVRPCFTRLLNDREPLVWRHAAVGRGLLATVDSFYQSEIENALDPSLSPTEWRRAAVSLVATLVGDPQGGMQQCRGLLESDVVRRDPGIAATMVWGLPPVIEAEPDAAEELLNRLCASRRPDVAEATAALLADLANWDFGARAATTVRAVLQARARQDSPERRVLTEQALQQVDRGHSDESTICAMVRRAVGAYETTGARAAYEAALEASARAEQAMARLLSLTGEREQTLCEVLPLLADLDTSLLEKSRLADLLLLTRRPGDADATVAELERLYDQFGTWLLDAEQGAEDEAAGWSALGALAKQRRLRALLHLVDLQTTARAETGETAERVKTRLRRTMVVLLDKIASNPDGSLHRILCATVARSFDAAVREGVADPSDLWLVIADCLTDPESLAAITEASTTAEMREAVGAYSEFVAASVAGADIDNPAQPAQPDAGHVANRIVRLSQGLGAGGSYRSEALRQVVLGLGRALEAIANTRGLSELADKSNSESDPVGALEGATEALRKLLVGVRRRVLQQERGPDPTRAADALPLSTLVERTVRGAAPDHAQFSTAMTGLTEDLPPPLAAATTEVVSRIRSLPVAAASDIFAIPLGKRRAALPDWLLPRRTIGAFYVVRALGSGGVSSVFVARRIEERHEPRAEAFALKVPEYDPTTARSLSEQEFMQMFRDEAGALISLPQHPNLARFVTFDLAARPKPILVMELIRGIGLDRLIRGRSLSMDRALQNLDGMLAGLDAMHTVEVGHLDIKPSNVILRDDEIPVLVDFGLSGRHLRPGCGTPEYCAPEVLGIIPDGYAPLPPAADMYAFACAAFELLTAELLFEGKDELSLISQHVSHDGWPRKLAALSRSAELRDLSVILAACLRRDPRDRPPANAARRALAKLRPRLAAHPWPIAVGAAAATG
jgi:hypothetical protein